MHFSLRKRIIGVIDWLSGLWHHQQERGHPFMCTVVRVPGPSCMEYFFMSKIIPVVFNPVMPPQIRPVQNVSRNNIF